MKIKMESYIQKNKQKNKNRVPLNDKKRQKNMSISKEKDEIYFRDDLLIENDNDLSVSISEISCKKSRQNEKVKNLNQNKKYNNETLSIDEEGEGSINKNNNSFLSDLNENEKQFMSDFILISQKNNNKNKYNSEIRIDLTENKIERIKILKENIKLLNEVITEKLREIIKEDSTKETDNKIYGIKYYSKKKRKRSKDI